MKGVQKKLLRKVRKKHSLLYNTEMKELINIVLSMHFLKALALYSISEGQNAQSIHHLLVIQQHRKLFLSSEISCWYKKAERYLSGKLGVGLRSSAQSQLIKQRVKRVDQHPHASSFLHCYHSRNSGIFYISLVDSTS